VTSFKVNNEQHNRFLLILPLGRWRNQVLCMVHHLYSQLV